MPVRASNGRPYLPLGAEVLNSQRFAVEGRDDEDEPQTVVVAPEDLERGVKVELLFVVKPGNAIGPFGHGCLFVCVCLCGGGGGGGKGYEHCNVQSVGGKGWRASCARTSWADC